MLAFPRAAYLARLGLTAVPDGPAGVATLQEAQLRAVPFENLDPLLGRTPDIALQAVAAKILEQGRGGYCFELNRLFGAALAACGHAPRMVLARVRPGRPGGGARTHLAFTVETGGRRLLADAGFGGPGSLAPLDLDRTGPQAAPNGTYRLRREAGETLVDLETPEGWFALYGFDEVPVRESDLDMANRFTATSPLAPFPANLMVSGWTGGTRLGLFNRALTRDGPAGRETATLDAPDHLRAVLCDALGLTLDSGTLEEIWRRLPG